MAFMSLTRPRLAAAGTGADGGVAGEVGGGAPGLAELLRSALVQRWGPSKPHKS